MPIYEYRCKTCGKNFEYNQRITEAALTKCPKEICESECKGEGEVMRVISKNIGLVFNGSGFYLTDYVHKHGSTSSNGNNHANGTNGKAKKNGETQPAETNTSSEQKKTTETKKTDAVAKS